jgi:DNA polymerase
LVKLPVLGANSRKIVREYRANNPLVTGFWKTFQEQLEASVGADLIVHLPSGRDLRYKNVRKSRRRMQDKKTGEYHERWVLSAEVEGHDTKLYGGILTENFVQALARDIFALGMLSVEDAGFRTLWSVHDELIVEVPLDQAPEPIVTAMTIMTPRNVRYRCGSTGRLAMAVLSGGPWPGSSPARTHRAVG